MLNTSLNQAEFSKRMVSRIRSVLVLGIVVAVMGVGGYTLIEGWSLSDCLYMTVITITTVGYGEVNNLSDTGRLFTIGLIAFGWASGLYAFGIFSQILLEGHLRNLFGRRRLARMIEALKDHIVVCGYGRIGSLVCREVAEEGIPFVVVENDPTMLDEIGSAGFLHVAGDATAEDVLVAAGIARARCLISALPTDASNVYTVLTARDLNKDLHIICRAQDLTGQDKMIRAGANKVISPYEIGGRSLVQAALRPNVLNFFEIATLQSSQAMAIEELIVSADSPLMGKTLLESRIREKYGVSVIVLQLPSEEPEFNPLPGAVMREGTVLIAMGKQEDLKKVAGDMLRTRTLGR